MASHGYLLTCTIYIYTATNLWTSRIRANCEFYLWSKPLHCSIIISAAMTEMPHYRKPPRRESACKQSILHNYRQIFVFFTYSELGALVLYVIYVHFDMHNYCVMLYVCMWEPISILYNTKPTCRCNLIIHVARLRDLISLLISFQYFLGRLS